MLDFVYVLSGKLYPHGICRQSVSAEGGRCWVLAARVVFCLIILIMEMDRRPRSPGASRWSHLRRLFSSKRVAVRGRWSSALTSPRHHRAVLDNPVAARRFSEDSQERAVAGLPQAFALFNLTGTIVTAHSRPAR
jgi:hypothetical protein